jgi:transcriptional regulator with XRE-family HTH domain
MNVEYISVTCRGRYMPTTEEMTSGGQCIAARVKDRRAARGWSQEELAHEAKVDKGVVIELESGRFLPPRGQGRPLRQVFEALDVDLSATLRTCYGEALRDNQYWAWCLTDPSLPVDVSLREFRERLTGLSDGALLQVMTPFPTHRMAFLDSVERAYGTYEAFVTNQPPFMFFDDQELAGGASRMARTDADAREYVELMRGYVADRLARLRSPGRRHEVVLARHGLVRFLTAMENRARAAELANRMIRAVKAHSSSLALYVLDTGRADLDEIELVSKNRLSLSSGTSDPTAFGTAICIFHYRLQPGEDRREYKFTMLIEHSLIPAQAAKMKRLWDGAHYQYIGQDPAVARDPPPAMGPAACAVTEARIRACLEEAYPGTGK